MGCGASTAGKPPAGEPIISRDQQNASVRTGADGKVVAYNSYEEWQKKNAARKLRAALQTDKGREELKALYAKLDIDGDGYLTSDEWSQGLVANEDMVKKYFAGCSVADNREVFTKIDVDNSGSLTWDEFLNGAMKSIQEVVSAA